MLSNFFMTCEEFQPRKHNSVWNSKHGIILCLSRLIFMTNRDWNHILLWVFIFLCSKLQYYLYSFSLECDTIPTAQFMNHGLYIWIAKRTNTTFWNNHSFSREQTIQPTFLQCSAMPTFWLFVLYLNQGFLIWFLWKNYNFIFTKSWNLVFNSILVAAKWFLTSRFQKHWLTSVNLTI